MANNGEHQDECNALETEKKPERLTTSRNREQRMAKTKDKVEESHLPTPPPDPWRTPECLQGAHTQDEMTRTRSLEEEEDIIAYLTDIGTPPFENRTSECPSRNSATSTMAVASLCTEETFEHLDRLYALTEQILELRNRSSRLFKRVRDLERLKALRNAHRRLDNIFATDKDLITNFSEEDTGFAESLLDAMLSNCRDPQLQRRNHRSPSSRRRSRSLALSEQSLPRLSTPINRLEAEKQISRNEDSAGGPKVSKWTRVKAAFKWERACTNDIVEMMDVTTTTTPSTPTTKYLRIPETGSGNWSGSTLSPCTSEISGPSTPLGRISSASSSNEGSYDSHRKNISMQLDRQGLKAGEERKKEGTSRRSRSLDGDMIVTNLLDNTEHKSETNHGKPLIRITTDNNSASHPTNSMERKDTEIVSKRPTPTLTITIPSNEEEIRSISSPESISPLLSSAQNSGGNSPQQAKPRQELNANREFKRQRSALEEVATPAPKMQRQDSKWNKVRRAFLTNSAFSVPPSPIRIVSGQSFLQDAYSYNGSVEDLEKTATSSAQAETRKDYQALREKLGAEFQRKLVEWERLKNMSPRVTVRNAREVMSSGNSREVLLPLEERLAPEFKKKLQDWKRAKKGRRGSATIEQQRFSRRRLTDWQLWRSPSKPEGRNQDTIGSRGSYGSGGSIGSTISDGRPHLCEDFVRRMEAWRRMNDTSYRGAETSKKSTSNRLGVASGIDESEFLVLERLLPNFVEKLRRERRDSDSRHLYERFDGDTRFVDGTQSINLGNEIFIRTSVGSYRFEGISREFTRKLYDWEKYRGISPRSSTFRLLGPGYAPFTGETDVQTPTIPANATHIADEEKVSLGILKRSKSTGSMNVGNHLNETFVRRSTSLQSLTQLADRLNDTDRIDTSPAPTETQRTEDACEDVIMDDSEPEAMIVDIEDVIEETASPLNRVQPHQTPVYSVAASETTSIAVPLGTVTSSHEPSPVFLVEIEENSNCKHWESRAWNQKKNISSDDSPSPEYFKVSKHWNERSDSLSRDDLDPEYWSLPASWNQGEYCSRDSFERYKLQDWNQKANNLIQDNDDVKTDRLLPSIEHHQKDQAEALDKLKDGIYVDLEKKELTAVLPDEEDIEENNVKKHASAEENGDKYKRAITETGIHSALLRDTKEKMDLSSEKKYGREYEHEDQKVEEDENRDIEKNSIESETKTKDIPELIIRGRENSSSYSSVDSRTTADDYDVTNSTLRSTTKAELGGSEDTLNIDFRYGNQDENIDRRRKSYDTTTHDLDTRQCNESCKVKSNLRNYETNYNSEDMFEVSSNASVSLNSNYKSENCTKESSSLVKSTERTERNEHRQYSNFRNLVTSFTHPIMSSSSRFEYHREPTIQTTPLTVTSSREERSYERIIINEETLNKIVVPTASTGDTKKTTLRMIERPTIPDDHSRKRDRQCEIDRDSMNRETSTKKNDSPTRNVFVKTKRMIFSPFRRTDDRTMCRKESDASDDDRTLRPKSKSKSRSASPKVSRQDALLRMPLSLPWPLRPSSRDRELKTDAKNDSRLENKQEGKGKVTNERTDLRKRTISEEQKRDLEVQPRRRSSETNTLQQHRMKGQVHTLKEEASSKESTEGTERSKNSFSEREHRVEVYEEFNIRATASEQRSQTLDTVSCSRTRSKENEIETSLRTDPLSSDLIHKLKILSSVAARRDGRTNTISIDPSLESHSSRIRRAKENFLSRRGGPLCHSVLEPQISETPSHDITRTTSNIYEQAFGDCEESSTKSKEITKTDRRVSVSEDTKGTEEKRMNSLEKPNETENEDSKSEVSGSSRPDLVKSASAGMINVNQDTFGQLAEPNRGCESLPRTISKRRESTGPFARIVNKFKLSRLIRGKDSEEDSMSTISKLCRQSLLIDVQSDFEEHRESEDQDYSEEHSQKDTNDDKTHNSRK